jgi:integrase
LPAGTSPSPSRRRPSRASEARAFTDDEAQRIVAAADATPRWGPFVRLAIATGLRRGELLALKWSDLDLERGIGIVRGSLCQTRAAGVTEKSTKGDRVRPLALSPMAIEALKRQSVSQAKEKLAAGPDYSDSGHVFQREIGGPVTPYTATDFFRRIASRAKVATTSLHACRHTTGTWLIAAGVDYRTASAVLGHANPSVTLGVYSHVVAGAQQKAVDLIGERFDGKRKPG